MRSRTNALTRLLATSVDGALCAALSSDPSPPKKPPGVMRPMSTPPSLKQATCGAREGMGLGGRGPPDR